MRRPSLPVLALAALTLAPVAAVAQTNAQRGAVDGANAGGAALGDVGAAIGAVTGAAVGGAADIAHSLTAPPPTIVKRTTCVTDASGNTRCDSIETTN